METIGILNSIGVALMSLACIGLCIVYRRQTKIFRKMDWHKRDDSKQPYDTYLTTHR